MSSDDASLENLAPKLFGTDGIRGLANRHPLTPELALRAGRAFGQILRATAPAGEPPLALVGRDTRISGTMLECALCAGLTAEGVHVFKTGVLPTPGVAFLVRDCQAQGGAMISASHNDFPDNGLKFFGAGGEKLTEDQERAIEVDIAHQTAEAALADRGPVEDMVGTAEFLHDTHTRYAAFLASTVPGLRLDGMIIALDCAHGAAVETTPRVLVELGAQVKLFHVEPNGKNINDKCGSTYAPEIQRLIHETGAHVGISHDGDADRVLLCDERGQVLDGDEILAIAGLDLLRRGQLIHHTLVATVMSNAGLDQAMQENGARVIRTGVGDRQVSEALISGGYVLGGEQSGHIIFKNHHTTGDGALTALQILAIMQRTGQPLSELRQCMTRLPQLLKNVAVPRKPPLEELAATQDAVRHAEAALGAPSSGRVMLRYSGTENKLRILLEGPEQSVLEAHATKIADAIARDLA